MNLSRWRNRPVLFIFLPIFGVLTFVLGVSALLRNDPSAVASIVQSAYPQQERTTELYINNYLNFPKQITKGQTVPFSFTVHNLEGTTTTYPFRVYLVSADNTQVRIASSTVTVHDGESKVVNLSYTFKTAGAVATVFIELPTVHESLHFALPTRI
jgi:hypothetical protein